MKVEAKRTTGVEDSVRKTVVIHASQQVAFRVFTEKMTSWWPATHHLGKADLKEAVIEPRIGGRWFERGTDGSECEWGKVLAWDPPRRLLLDWQINGEWKHDPTIHTEVEVRFIAEDVNRTRVELEHRNMDRFGQLREATQAALQGEGGWGGIMEVYAAVAGRAA